MSKRSHGEGLSIREISGVSGITTRALRWYDRLGLVVPDRQPKTAYRIYREEHLKRLQDVLYFRELGFPLAEIVRILEDPRFNREQALKQQLAMLKERRFSLDTMIKTLELAIAEEQGVYAMNDKERFKGFDFSRNSFEQEARERWGEDAVDQAQKTIGAWSEVEKENMGNDMHAMFTELASIRESDPCSPVARIAMRKWYELLNRMGSYSPTMFANLGRMYVDDARFTRNLDRYGEGLARFMCDAMVAFAKKHE